jgi:CHAT domain-containing protein/tetratricopeptide (TPR) repeat protein
MTASDRPRFDLRRRRLLLLLLGAAAAAALAIASREMRTSAATTTAWLHSAPRLAPSAAAGGEPDPAVRARFLLGTAREGRRHYREALADYRWVLPRWSGRAQGDAVLNAMGRCYRELGMVEEASAAFRQAALRSERLGDGREHAAALDNLALVHRSKGEFQPALELLAQALRDFHGLHDDADEATVLCDIGEIYFDLGAWQSSIDASRKALAIQRRIGDRPGMLVALRNLGAAYLGRQQWSLARAQFVKVARLAREEGDRAIEMSADNGLAYIHLMSGEIGSAVAAAREALRLARAAGKRGGEANALGNLGGAYGRGGETERALASFASARDIYRQRGEPASEASILFGRAEVLEQAGRLDEAQAAIEQSLTLVERLRAQPAGSGLRASFFAARQDYYELYVRVLMQLDRLRPGRGYDALAFEASEQTRARTLLEGLAAAHLDLAAGADHSLLEREAATRRLVGIVQAERDGSAISYSPEAVGRLPGLDAELRRLRSQLEEVRAEMRSRDPRYRVLNDTRPLRLTQIQREILDPGTLLLAYSLGTRESYLWSIDRGALHAHRLAGRQRIERAAVGAYQALAASGGVEGLVEAERRVSELSSLVLAPVAGELAGKRLLIVADGALQFIPFGALPVPRESPGDGKNVDPSPLVADHEIVYLPSASVVSLLRRQTAGRSGPRKQLAVLADPVFRTDDPRVERGLGVPRDVDPAADHTPAAIDAERSARDVGLNALTRLRFSRTEADAILQLVPAQLALRATDFAASRDLAVSPELARYRILHFATHGFLDAVHPELSGLVFSLVDAHGRPRDGFLHAYEIYGLHLPADLVVLSACRTALGTEVRGEGLMGLTRGFMYAGAPRVLVSLWNISDHATADLMAGFYRSLLRQRLPPAAALRAAQLITRSHWPSPYYWAAFELQGDWR